PIEQGPNPDADINQGGFHMFIVDNVMGLYEAFESEGRFGYDLSIDPENPAVIGLPPGPGSVVVGSPFQRPNGSAGAYNPTGFGGGFDLNRPDQGVFARGGQNVGSIAIHGIVHGASRIEGFIDRVALGYFPGSLTVKGDLGELIVGSDAGLYVLEDRLSTIKTTGQLVVERTIGEVEIAGRSLMDITVIGDMSAPGDRPPRDIY